MIDSNTIHLKCWADLACFTRPELKVERVSYPFITPSAARGVLDAILFKHRTIGEGPDAIKTAAFRWHIRSVTIIAPPGRSATDLSHGTIAVRRNEIQGKIAPKSVLAQAAAGRIEPCLVDSGGREAIDGANRTQRNTLMLRDVAYIISASVKLHGSTDAYELVKYREMFLRRAESGQCFQQPYFGCREFACHFALPDGSEQLISRFDGQHGLMLYDMIFPEPLPPGQARKPSSPTPTSSFFQATVQGGVLHCDTAASSRDGRVAIQVFS